MRCSETRSLSLTALRLSLSLSLCLLVSVSVSVSLSLTTLRLCLCVLCNSPRPSVSPRLRSHRTSALSSRSVSACTEDVSASFLALQVRELHVEKTVVCRPVSLRESWCLQILLSVTSAHAFGNQRRALTPRRGKQHHHFGAKKMLEAQKEIRCSWKSKPGARLEPGRVEL